MTDVVFQSREAAIAIEEQYSQVSAMDRKHQPYEQGLRIP